MLGLLETPRVQIDTCEKEKEKEKETISRSEEFYLGSSLNLTLS